ncbi:MAG: sigma 54-interacting transcriptional regulator [Nitrospiraceae bacterium]
MPTTKPSTFTILLIEDNGGDVEMFLRAVEHELPRHEDEEVELLINATAEGGLERLSHEPIDLIITDVRLPGMSGIELLRRVQDMNRRIPVIVVSWVNAVDTAIDAMRHGAFDYVVKPFDAMDLAARIHRAMRMADILRHTEPNGTDSQPMPFKDLVGVSPPIKNVMQMIEAIAKVPSTTLIIGETGTGKELIAKAIHERSAERDGPFQVVDCTTFAEGTVESELFGHVRGAFTGAVSDKTGLIESGSRGTVFLDEIGDLPANLQAKLLRVLEEGEVRAVGTQQKKVNVRFVAATNQDLAEKVVGATNFARTCFSGSTSWSSASRPCANGRKTSPSWLGISCRAMPRNSASTPTIFIRRPSPNWLPIPGPVTCASSATSWSARSCWPRAIESP